uniref:Uncharacterized protein n=1 Tax=Romanomermis culicivorax TaxID=13658 RepID=A0A915IBH2_ROMCU
MVPVPDASLILKPAVTMDEKALTIILAKFSDVFEIKVGASEQFYVRLAKFSGGHVNIQKDKLDLTKFLVTPAANIQQLNSEGSPVQDNCCISPSTSQGDVSLSDPIDGVFDLRSYFYCNRSADYRLSFRELENLYQSRANDLCKLDDILDKIKDRLQYYVVDYAEYEVRRRKTFSVNFRIECLSNLVSGVNGVLCEKSSITFLDLEVGENLEVKNFLNM